MRPIATASLCVARVGSCVHWPLCRIVSEEVEAANGSCCWSAVLVLGPTGRSMRLSGALWVAGACCLMWSAVAFQPLPPMRAGTAVEQGSPFGQGTLSRRSLQRMLSSVAEIDEATLGLTPRLREVSRAFRLMDDRTRVQQLLTLATSLKPLKDQYRIGENKVPGCLSTVFVNAYLKDGKVFYEGDSDAQLTKGLVALLIDGMSGCTAAEIQEVKPEFIKYAGIGASLTPGRNNGFLNMLAVMKRKATEAEKRGELPEGAGDIEFVEEMGRPMYNSMMKKLLNFLKPRKLTLDDDSAQHAGHAGAKGFNGESHFTLKIVADCFEGLTSVQRHKLIYTLLAAEMQQIHALSIEAKTPSEAGL